jgi:hypothetical protein
VVIGALILAGCGKSMIVPAGAERSVSDAGSKVIFSIHTRLSG